MIKVVIWLRLYTLEDSVLGRRKSQRKCLEVALWGHKKEAKEMQPSAEWRIAEVRNVMDS